MAGQPPPSYPPPREVASSLEKTADPLEPCIVKVFEMMNFNDWRLKSEKDGMKCYARTFPDCPKDGTMLRFLIPGVRASQMDAWLNDDEKEFAHDTLLREKKVVQIVSRRAMVLHKRYASPVSALIVRPRDMVFGVIPATYLSVEQQRTYGVLPRDPPGEPTVFVHAGYDMSTSYPVPDGHVRSVLHSVGYVAQEEREGCLMTIVFLYDPSGYIPATIYNMIVHSMQIKKFLAVRDVLTGKTPPTKPDCADEE